ncbi:MAG TPA: hypothetical protein VFU05_01360 [Cyclobacteriaceae bacterium]|nr:hypothetical protein [Cyclobacteriaceae bacterium]
MPKFKEKKRMRLVAIIFGVLFSASAVFAQTEQAKREENSEKRVQANEKQQAKVDNREGKGRKDDRLDKLDQNQKRAHKRANRRKDKAKKSN